MVNFSRMGLRVLANVVCTCSVTLPVWFATKYVGFSFTVDCTIIKLCNRAKTYLRQLVKSAEEETPRSFLLQKPLFITFWLHRQLGVRLQLSSASMLFFISFHLQNAPRCVAHCVECDRPYPQIPMSLRAMSTSAVILTAVREGLLKWSGTPWAYDSPTRRSSWESDHGHLT